jgi:Protein of unknown function (DUF1186)
MTYQENNPTIKALYGFVADSDPIQPGTPAAAAVQRIQQSVELIRANRIVEAEMLLCQPHSMETLMGKQESYPAFLIFSYYSAVIELCLAQEKSDDAGSALALLVLLDRYSLQTLRLNNALRDLSSKLCEERSRRYRLYWRSVSDCPTAYYEPASKPPKLRHPELEIFYRVDTGMIPQEAVAAIRTLPRKTLREDLENILIDSIRRYEIFADDKDDKYDCETNAFPLHALYWLGELQMSKSLQAVLDWFRQGGDFVDFWTNHEMPDGVTESLYGLAQNNLDELLAYVIEPNQCWSTRSAAADVVEKVARRQPERHAECVAWFRELIRFTCDNLDDKDLIDCDFLSSCSGNILNFRGIELLPEIKDLFDFNLILEDYIGDLEQIEKQIREPQEAETIPRASIAHHYGNGVPSDAICLPDPSKETPTRFGILFDYYTSLRVQNQ